jgi:hypothetical protein
MSAKTDHKSVGLAYEKRHTSTPCSAGVAPFVDAGAAHQLKALATPDAGAAPASAPMRAPGAAAHHQTTCATTVARSTRLAPAGGLAAASAEAPPAAGRVHLALEPVLAVLDALTQAADHALQAVGAAVRRSLAWRPWPAAVDPHPPVAPAAPLPLSPGPHPNSLYHHPHPPK